VALDVTVESTFICTYKPCLESDTEFASRCSHVRCGRFVATGWERYLRDGSKVVPLGLLNCRQRVINNTVTGRVKRMVQRYRT
jgi:hypothetical protein